MVTGDFEVRRATASDTPEVLKALSDGYGRPFTQEWLQWKHLDSPWGPSRCWLALDDGGTLGVVFGQPWRLNYGDDEISCRRLVDGATTVRAQRRGVFRAVVRAELDAAASSGPPGLVIATATPEARDAHVKNGATALDPIESWYRPVRWAPAGTETTCQPPEAPEQSTASRFASIWDEAALRWRLDPRSGLSYDVTSLSNSSSRTVVVYRTVTAKRVRTLVITAEWGPTEEVAQLIRALAWKEKAVAVLSPAGPGATAPKPRLGLSKGQSILCVWDQRVAESHLERSDWALQGLDVEGVV